jgi:hypothetical protein
MNLVHKFANITVRGLALLGLWAFLSPLAAWGMNCPFCYSKAMSSSAGMLQAFRSGILVLMVPPFLMSAAFTIVAYKRRNRFHQPDGQDLDLEKR